MTAISGVRRRMITLQKNRRAMTAEMLTEILDALLSLPAETEVVEFKKAERNFDDRELGQYFSALSNEANLRSKPCAWLVFGVENGTHQVVGTQYKNTRPALDAMKKKVADQTTGRHTFVEIHELWYMNGKRVVMFEIPPAPAGIPIAFQDHYYGRDGESLQGLSIEKLERIRMQAAAKDWSAEILPEASLADLDPAAIAKARELYTDAHKDKAEEIAAWDDTTFLNKAKITIRGKITRAAIILLGREESESLLSPAVAKIKWILRGPDDIERDYAIASCPFVLAVDRIYDKIRNLKYRYINPAHKTLFPDEIDTYEPYVIREALNNAIAHQDYTLGGQINVVEYDDKLVFSNKGSFIPGNIERVLVNNAPEEYYRNPFLVTAMVGLRMVDTIGSGIRKMYTFQRQRLFPLPDYKLEANRVEVTITGKILDMNYANILAENPDLNLLDIELLNRVQLGRSLSDEEIARLRSKRLIEGRKPKLYIARQIAQKVGQKVEYSEHKGLGNKRCEEFLLTALRDHQSLSRPEIDRLLWPLLPNLLDEKQKKDKITNLLTKLRKQGKIRNRSQGPNSEWLIV